MKSVRGSNYDEDGREHLSQFLNVLLENRSTSSHFISDDSQKEIIISNMRRFTSTLQAWHKIVLFSAHVQINLEKLITSS